MSKLDYFTNDNFKVLDYLYDQRNAENIVSITQQEIADKFGVGRVKINKMIADLTQKGYLKRIESKMARYVMSQEAIDFVKAVRAANRKWGFSYVAKRYNRYYRF